MKKQLLHQKMMGVSARPPLIEAPTRIPPNTESSPLPSAIEKRQFELLNPHHGEYAEKSRGLIRSNTLLSGQTNPTHRNSNHDDGLS